MVDTEAQIIENKNIVLDYFLLKLKLAKTMGKIMPGQFIMLKIPGNEVFLRRPFSIYDYDKDILTVMYKVVGKGTEILSKTSKDNSAFVLGPLGNGFRVNKRDVYLTVAGGIGIAGIHFLIKTLKEKASVFFGCSSNIETTLLKDITHLNPMISTLDGSYGYKGNVVEMLTNYLETVENVDQELFICGPEGMLKSLKASINKSKISCQALVEERMACGLGLCFGCVKKTIDENEPYKRVCKEGPVFDLWEISL
ncbi:MAG: dihydroorotate dehydrogenase electron transfer subunit [Proteobacteria bacterium]|nr:dihydroorotate dehydrogenase electron transfer subunit [Pseudomonadota bacterium]